MLSRTLLRLAMSLALMAPLTVAAQGFTATGVVRDASDNQPIPGVAVLVVGTTTGTVTDFDGNFSVSCPKTTYRGIRS